MSLDCTRNGLGALTCMENIYLVSFLRAIVNEGE